MLSRPGSDQSWSAAVLFLISQSLGLRSFILFSQLADKDIFFPEDRAASRGCVKIVSMCERRYGETCVRGCAWVLRLSFWPLSYFCMSAGLSEFCTNLSFLCFSGVFCRLPRWPTVSCANSFHWCQVFPGNHWKLKTKEPFFVLKLEFSSGVLNIRLTVPPCVLTLQVMSNIRLH